MIRRRVIWFVVLLAVIFTLQACGGGGSSSSGGASAGAVNVSLVDAPGDYDNVWVTVKDVWFHTSAEAGPDDQGWIKYPLRSPVLIDLAALSNGSMSQNIWNGIELPAGVYRQIRLFLVETNAANPPFGHDHFNEAVWGGSTFPLRIPDADGGISLVGTFPVTNGSTLRLAIDFNVGDDVVDFNGSEYILKPRLACFDLDNVGAIVGQISTGAVFDKAAHFVIKAESLSTGGTGTHHVVHRSTSPDSRGKFILFPVSAATATYDVLIRGIGYETTIVKEVPVSSGTTTMFSPTKLPVISMITGSDYVSSATITSPTGAWVDFYQTLTSTGTGTEYPYEVRFRHFNPITGSFSGFMLSNSPLRWGVYSSISSTITFTAADPAECVSGAGCYQAVAGADEELYNSSGFPGSIITSSSPTVTFDPLTVMSPWQGNKITGVISLSSPTAMTGKMNTGVVLAVHRGLIVNAISTFEDTLPASVVSTGGTYTISNLPGGTATTPLPSAFYAVDAVFWASPPVPEPYQAIAFPPQFADLRTGDGTANLTMYWFRCWW